MSNNKLNNLLKTGTFYHENYFPSYVNCGAQGEHKMALAEKRAIRVLNGRRTHTFDLLGNRIIYQNDNSSNDFEHIFETKKEARLFWKKHFSNIPEYDGEGE